MSDTLSVGTPYRDEDWPHGLMCATCDHLFTEGDLYAMGFNSFVGDTPIMLVTCVPCSDAVAKGEK